VSATFRPVMVIDRGGATLATRSRAIDRSTIAKDGRPFRVGRCVVGGPDPVEGDDHRDLAGGELAREPLGDRGPVAEQDSGQNS
jgi:hypothetical protein